MQLSRGDEDPNPLIVNTELNITSCGWNNKGTILAVTGTIRTSANKSKGDFAEEKESRMRGGDAKGRGMSGDEVSQSKPAFAQFFMIQLRRRMKDRQMRLSPAIRMSSRRM
jgi:hypothetical protein